MLRFLSGYSWLEELGENTKEIDECLEKGLIKYVYGEDGDSPTFIILESNIPVVKEILKEDYNKLHERTLIEWIDFEFTGCYDEMKIKNSYGDKFRISMDNISSLIEDETEVYFPEDKQLLIYNAEYPNDELKFMIDEIGREQARIQIQDLLNSIVDQEFR